MIHPRNLRRRNASRGETASNRCVGVIDGSSERWLICITLEAHGIECLGHIRSVSKQYPYPCKRNKKLTPLMPATPVWAPFTASTRPSGSKMSSTISLGCGMDSTFHPALIPVGESTIRAHWADAGICEEYWVSSSVSSTTEPPHIMISGVKLFACVKGSKTADAEKGELMRTPFGMPGSRVSVLVFQSNSMAC